jgi:hypothetical protein
MLPSLSSAVNVLTNPIGRVYDPFKYPLRYDKALHDPAIITSFYYEMSIVDIVVSFQPLNTVAMYGSTFCVILLSEYPLNTVILCLCGTDIAGARM